jgi:nucleotide-binding universal stress UspA family protein
MQMAYKTILICLNSIQAVPALIAAARDLGTRFDAHIRALYVIPGAQVYTGSEFAGSFVFNEEVRRYYEKHKDQVQKTFTENMQKDGLAFDYELIDSVVPNTTADFVDHARSSDLVVVSPLENDNFPGVEPDFVEQMVMGSGRPVLILSENKNYAKISDEILVAWNDSRESARATFDALPFIQTAHRTRIATIGLHRGRVLGATIAEVLDRHGAKAETVNLSLDGLTEGEVLLRATRDHGAGLLVMGCYGHGRFTEFVFGGVSRHVLKNLTLPILMSH